MKDRSEKLEEIRNEYHIDRNIGFNIFTSISDTYYKENFHSNVLKLILDPNTEVIGNSQFISEFLNILNTLKSDVKTMPYSKNLKVVREEGGIDLLIHDGKHAVIIENKINNAVDQDDQLARYFKYVNKDKKLDVLAIVYLPLSPEKKPQLENYSKQYAKYVDKINNKLVILPAIDKSKVDYAHGFLDKCDELSTDEITRVLLASIHNW